MTPEQKEWIDNASYQSLLSRWRHAPMSDPMFQGEAGDYYTKVMSQRRREVGNASHVAASKNIGWD